MPNLGWDRDAGQRCFVLLLPQIVFIKFLLTIARVGWGIASGNIQKFPHNLDVVILGKVK